MGIRSAVVFGLVVRVMLMFLVLVMFGVALYLFVTAKEVPRADRNWIDSHRVAPRIQFAGDSVTVAGVRNFAWRSDSVYDARWDTRSYDLTKIQRVWFGVSTFVDSWRGPAHAFLAFEFADSQRVAISVEARREVGEEYSVVEGMLNRFETIYVIGDERDIIGLRTNIWQDPVYLYPVAAPAGKVRELFVSMLEGAESVATQPKFYNTVADNCLSALLRAANEAREEQIPFGLDVVLPGYADRRLLKLGLIDTDLTLEQARRAFVINERANAGSLLDADFSERIRTVSSPGTP